MSSNVPDADVPGPDRTASARIWEAVGLGVLGLVVIGGIGWWLTLDPGTDVDPAADERRGSTPIHQAGFSREDFLGDDACAACHPSIGVYHERHGHSRTLRRAEDRALADRLDGRVVPDPERPGVSWTFLKDDGRLAVDRRQGDRVDRMPIDFAFGSGYHATTFLSVLDPDPKAFTVREHRLTYYHDDSIRITPGQGADEPSPGTDALGRVLTGKQAADCVHCHVTLTSATKLGVVDVDSMIPTVSCERCHGPGRSHVEAARRDADASAEALAMPFGPGRAIAEQEMLLCGDCHRHPSMAPAAAIRPDNFELARFQPIGLMQSRCYTESAGALSCTTCHDPHDRPSTDPLTYNTTCLSCHQPNTPEHVSCPQSPTTGCTSCHMPRVDAGQGIAFADHWIRVRDRQAQPDALPSNTPP